MSRRKQAKPRAFKRKFWEYFLKCSLLFLNLALHSKKKTLRTGASVELFCSPCFLQVPRDSLVRSSAQVPIGARVSLPESHFQFSPGHPRRTRVAQSSLSVGRSVWTDGLCCIHFYNNHFHTAGTKWEILWGPAIPARRSYYCNVNMKMNVLL